MVRSHRASAARREGVSNHDPSSRSSLLTTNGIEETTSARVVQGEGRSVVWWLRLACDAIVERSLLRFVLGPLMRPSKLGSTRAERCSRASSALRGWRGAAEQARLYERGKVQPSKLGSTRAERCSRVSSALREREGAAEQAWFCEGGGQPSEASHSSSEPSLTPSNKKVER